MDKEGELGILKAISKLADIEIVKAGVVDKMIKRFNDLEKSVERIESTVEENNAILRGLEDRREGG